MIGAIGETSLEVARPMIERWHYSHRVPTGQNIFFAWRVPTVAGLAADMLGDALYAVACYGIGVNPYQAAFLAREYGYEVETEQLVELKRLCRVEPKVDAYPLTHFLAQCHRALRVRGYRVVVSFSDPAHSHTGGIYRAANFQHRGQTQAEFHLQGEDGEVRHRRFAFRYARRNGVPTAQAREELGLERIETPPKDRWVLSL